MAITTNNYKLTQLELTNVANFPLLLNDTFKTIDKGLTLEVGTSTGTGNNYVLNLGSITLSSANKGISFKFWADKNSTGAVTINGTYHLVKANGNPIKNIKKNAPYIITYDGNTNFFLSSGGADESDSTTVGIDGSKVLAGETFIGSDGEIHTGTIPIRNAINTTLKAGQSVTLDSGYYKDKSTIKAEALATAMTNAGVTLANANQLVNGVKAVDKNGSLITGTADITSLGGYEMIKGSVDINLSYDGVGASNSYIWTNQTIKLKECFGNKFKNIIAYWLSFDYIEGSGTSRVVRQKICPSGIIIPNEKYLMTPNGSMNYPQYATSTTTDKCYDNYTLLDIGNNYPIGAYGSSDPSSSETTKLTYFLICQKA